LAADVEPAVWSGQVTTAVDRPGRVRVEGRRISGASTVRVDNIVWTNQPLSVGDPIVADGFDLADGLSPDSAVWNESVDAASTASIIAAMVSSGGLERGNLGVPGS
jgi:hypothetical protein